MLSFFSIPVSPQVITPLPLFGPSTSSQLSSEPGCSSSAGMMRNMITPHIPQLPKGPGLFMEFPLPYFASSNVSQLFKVAKNTERTCARTDLVYIHRFMAEDMIAAATMMATQLQFPYPFLIPPVVGCPTQGWHEHVKPGLRHHLVRKL